MNRISILKLIAFNLLAIFLLQSCSTNDATPGGSRAVKYEITGDYTGSMTVALVAANGSFEAFEVKKLPWIYEITADKSVTQIGASAQGSAGKDGQKATFKVYVGGKEVSSGAGTAISGGILILSPKFYSF